MPHDSAPRRDSWRRTPTLETTAPGATAAQGAPETRPPQRPRVPCSSWPPARSAPVHHPDHRVHGAAGVPRSPSRHPGLHPGWTSPCS
ncbi:hypothetical protein QJS66_12210 [Kocuria rhizophila]|nr:hypothetical protein QJS66_12210 [Kocuria rhizophila]